jgi:hypothetical protein
MAAVASSMRSNDQAKLNKSRGEIIKKLANGRPIVPDIGTTTQASTLRFNHAITARALVPIRKCDAYGANPET